MIKNVVLDIGNVLLKFNPKEYFSAKTQNLELCVSLCDMMMNGEIWKAYDLGDYSMNDVRKKFVEAMPLYQTEINAMLDEWTNILQPIEYTFEKMRQLRCEGYQIYLLSNLNEDAYEYILNHVDLFDLVDGFVVSFKERLAKPDSKIYECLLNRYQLKVEECVFIDDIEKNIQAAIDVGMQGIVFHNEQQVEEDLNRILYGE